MKVKWYLYLKMKNISKNNPNWQSNDIEANQIDYGHLHLQACSYGNTCKKGSFGFVRFQQKRANEVFMSLGSDTNLRGLDICWQAAVWMQGEPKHQRLCVPPPHRLWRDSWSCRRRPSRGSRRIHRSRQKSSSTLWLRISQLSHLLSLAHSQHEHCFRGTISRDFSL